MRWFNAAAEQGSLPAMARLGDHRNQKLKDAIAQLLELGMAARSGAAEAPVLPKPVRLAGQGPIKIEDVQAAIASGHEMLPITAPRRP